jgi:hypothetical protein
MLPFINGLASWSLYSTKDELASSPKYNIWINADGLASASYCILKKDWPVATIEQYYPLQMNWPVSCNTTL